MVMTTKTRAVFFWKFKKIYCIKEILFLKLMDHIKKNTISEKTYWNYIYLWEYKYDKRRKRVYYNRYKWLDIVKYKKEWLKRMFEYQKYIKFFDGIILDVVLESQLKLEEKELVQVMYDECYFYANDRQ